MARAHRLLLPKLIQSIDTWMSGEDVDKGRSWSRELASVLADSDFGIICLTPENKDSRWIHFEAGALSKHFEKAYVWTNLFDLRYRDIEQPLAEFQHTLATKEDTKKLVKTINKLAKEQTGIYLREEHFESSFDAWWNEFEEQLGAVPVFPAEAHPPRSDEDVISETLELVRDLWRSEQPNRVGLTLPSAAELNNTMRAAYAVPLRRAKAAGEPEPTPPMTFTTGDTFDHDVYFAQIRSYLGWPAEESRD